MKNPFVNIPSPKFPPHSIEIFTKEEIDKLLKACAFSREASPGNRRSFVMRRPFADRDKAILLTLLDTGMRASVNKLLAVATCQGLFNHFHYFHVPFHEA
jgi:integrase/recombinase XerD